MTFQENDTLSAIRSMVRDFAAQEMEQHILDWDERQHFPRALFGKMGELGLMGMLVPEQYGGIGLDYPEYVAASKSSRRCAVPLASVWPRTTACVRTTF